MNALTIRSGNVQVTLSQPPGLAFDSADEGLVVCELKRAHQTQLNALGLMNWLEPEMIEAIADNAEAAKAWAVAYREEQAVKHAPKIPTPKAHGKADPRDIAIAHEARSTAAMRYPHKIDRTCPECGGRQCVAKSKSMVECQAEGCGNRWTDGG